jgi:hypothetical protein
MDVTYADTYLSFLERVLPLAWLQKLPAERYDAVLSECVLRACEMLPDWPGSPAVREDFRANIFEAIRVLRDSQQSEKN